MYILFAVKVFGTYALLGSFAAVGGVKQLGVKQFREAILPWLKFAPSIIPGAILVGGDGALVSGWPWWSVFITTLRCSSNSTESILFFSCLHLLCVSSGYTHPRINSSSDQ